MTRVLLLPGGLYSPLHDGIFLFLAVRASPPMLPVMGCRISLQRQCLQGIVSLMPWQSPTGHEMATDEIQGTSRVTWARSGIHPSLHREIDLIRTLFLISVSFSRLLIASTPPSISSQSRAITRRKKRRARNERLKKKVQRQERKYVHQK